MGLTKLQKLLQCITGATFLISIDPAGHKCQCQGFSIPNSPVHFQNHGQERAIAATINNQQKSLLMASTTQYLLQHHRIETPEDHLYNQFKLLQVLNAQLSQLSLHSPHALHPQGLKLEIRKIQVSQHQTSTKLANEPSKQAIIQATAVSKNHFLLFTNHITWT